MHVWRLAADHIMDILTDTINLYSSHPLIPDQLLMHVLYTRERGSDQSDARHSQGHAE